MNRAFIVREEADDDVSDARRWYNRQRPGLGFDFVEKVEEAFLRIQRDPELPRRGFRDTRQVAVDRFPYAVVYEVDDAQITVVAVWNTHRDPQGWQTRI